MPEKSLANKNTQQSQRQTRAAGERDEGAGGLGRDGTTLDDDDERRRRPFQVQIRPD